MKKSFRGAKQGWYKVKNPSKFIEPIDKFMGSFKIYNNELYVNYKSNLERKTIIALDSSDFIEEWSLEPFFIEYIKPTDNKPHRYFIDMFAKIDGQGYLIEVKPESQTQPPKIPKKPTRKSAYKYNSDLVTFAVNDAKWYATLKFCEDNNFKFSIMTEKRIDDFYESAKINENYNLPIVQNQKII